MKELLERRAALISEQRALVEAARAENRELTDEEATKFDELDAKIDALDAQIERERKLEAREASLDEPVERVHRPRAIPGPEPVEKYDDGGFRNLGEFLDALRFGDPKGRIEALEPNPRGNPGLKMPEKFAVQLRRGLRAQNGEGAPEWSVTGNPVLVPPQHSTEVLMLQPETSIVRPRATVIPPGEPPDAKITFPAFKQGGDGVFGGVEVQWINEGGVKPETGGEFGEVSLEPQEVAATTVVTDKLLRNWQAGSAFIQFLLRGAMASAEDLAFLSGDGKGKPLGVLNGAGAITVHRANAGTVTYPDVVAMLAKLLPQSRSSAVWVASQDLLPEIATMQDGNGRYIYIQGDATRGIPDTLVGLPVRWTGKTAAKGSKGDLMLVDFTYYLIKDGSGPYVAASEHVLFRQNKTVIKCFWNVDGTGWVEEPLTLENGTTQVSPYVVLGVANGGEGEGEGEEV